MMINNKAFRVKNCDHTGVVVLRLFDTSNERIEVYTACLNKYGFEPTEYYEINLDHVMINQLTVEELRLILKYNY